jgi:hypothetical protein
MVIFFIFFRRKTKYGKAVDIKCCVLSRWWHCAMERKISLLLCSVSHFCNDIDDEACNVDDKGTLDLKWRLQLQYKLNLAAMTVAYLV